MLVSMVCGLIMVSCGGGSGNNATVNETESQSTAKSEEDKLVDELEKLLEDYLETARQLASGNTDMALITKAQTQGARFAELSVEAELAHEEGRLTEEQVARIDKLGEKFTEMFQ